MEKSMKKEAYKCRKCGITIGGHNKFLHDGMCDECFFETYFLEEIEIFEINSKKLPELCKQREQENNIFYHYLKSDKLNQRRFSNIVKEVTKKLIVQYAEIVVR
jgi:NMD protein affecting ribosome stability and mRNA decay